MTKVLIHGFPETKAIWDPLVPLLTSRDVVRLELPGFGCAAPAEWSATKEEYLDWLIGSLGELARESGPLDVVGHDWGGALLLPAVAARPDFIRSWVTDIAGAFHPRYVWHDFAQLMQSPEATPQLIIDSLPVETFDLLGLPRAVGAPIAASIDEEYARCSLALYRSAAQPEMAIWGETISGASVRPGLVLLAEDDHYVGNVDQFHSVAELLGAPVKVIEGQGHWWMTGDPPGATRVLEEFWMNLD